MCKYLVKIAIYVIKNVKNSQKSENSRKYVTTYVICKKTGKYVKYVKTTWA